MLTVSRKPAEKSPPRMEALAKLPVFFDLDGKRTVLVGGTAAAAWKAELLAAAGANVQVYATALDGEMAALLERGAASGSLAHHSRPWGTDIFAGAAIALADLADEAQAEAFYCAAKAAGVPVNVIDKPAYCQFQFGSIVNRSPVVISISTDGGAPVLGQAIRRRIETLLPASLAAWAKRAKEIRSEVNARFAHGLQRRAFWELFSDRAFGKAPREGDFDSCHHLIAAMTGSATEADGKVTLVGAGPGDAELLTLKAVRALQAADVILFDDLVSDDVLELARREAKRMLVGKRSGRDSCRQDEINDLMIKLARQGKHVVRLKSGDPMVFGRAGEEIARLTDEGVEVGIVPGISSALAMASELGISLTHRDHAHSLRFITGHARNGELPDDLDWKGIADPKTTLIVYMGGRTSSQLAGRLILEGLSPQTPVIVATQISRADGRHTHTTLAGLRLDGIEPRPTGPVLIGIGRVFGSGKQDFEAPALIQKFA